MIYKARFSMALVMSAVMLSLVTFMPKSQAQPPQRFTLDSGLVTPGSNQVLRITVNNPDRVNGGITVFLFRGMEYTQAGCSGGVWKHMLAAQTATGPVQLAPGEGASIDIPSAGSGIRGAVVSNSKDIQVNMLILNSVTGDYVGVIHPFGDF